ncbi:S-layer homology domain-containing protein [Evtepia sp.]|mgnify:FL=1|uniref:S-layer homology domain-containing protein n=1 Tax=Evtepia sp. TaxID=2773933 RepID=UPI00399AC8C3
MMRKKIVSLCMALALCLSLLPATALAATPNGQVLYIGGVQISSTGYWTTDSEGKVTSAGATQPSDNYIHYDVANNTLTLHNATIKESVSTDTSTFIAGAAIGVHNQNGAAELTITLEGTNTIAEVGKGIYVLANSTGGATLTITGDGSLDASARQTGIWVQSNSGNATLTIRKAKVEATGTSTAGYGVNVQSSNSSTASLTVDGGSLTASGNPGILYDSSGSGTVPNTTTLTIRKSAIVDAREGGIGAGYIVNLSGVSPTDDSVGIVFGLDLSDSKAGAVYGDVTLQENLTIGEGESLTLAENASLAAGGHNVIVDGGTLDESLAESLGESVKYAPTITTTTLTGGRVGESYSASLGADGTAPITWDLAEGSSLPDGLSLNSDGTITGTPTTAGTSTFTVKAENDYGNDSTQFTLTIEAAANVPVDRVALSPSTLNLKEDETGTLTATVEPSNATNKNVTWESSNTSVATVDATGEVTAIGAGTATITVTTEDGNKTATCAVTVTAATVSVTGVTLSQNEAHLYYNRTPNTLTLTATVAPDNATDKTVTWTSSNPSVATVENGVVTAVACGTAVITATAADGSGASASCTVTVSSYLPPANPNYRITVEATQGGTVTADPTAAKAGATVTLTPVPDRGYQVGSVAVTDRFGNAVAVTEQADGTYTFTMPNGQVTVTVTFAEAPLPFPDVAEGDWFYDAVRYAYENGLMDGVGDNLFAPNSETTRAQLVTILYRLEGEPEVSGTSGFTDVEAGTWYTDAVAWAAANGIVNGVSETEFAPGKDITREQLATILFRYAEAKGYDVSARADLSAYPDADQIQSYATESVAWAVAEGLIQGFEDNTLRPAGNATRAQIATILMRFCEGVAK